MRTRKQKKGIKMDGFAFYAVMPDERNSKSASKKYPLRFNRAMLKISAEANRYVECMAVATDRAQHYNHSGKYMMECISALMVDNDQAVCSSSTSRDYLRKRCIRISESLARKLHPALFRYLAD